MIEHAEEIGANAIISMRYDANEVMAGLTEVLAYGTAVVVEKIAWYLKYNPLSFIRKEAFL